MSALLVTTLFNGILLCAPTRAETFTTLRGALDEVADKYQIHVGLEYANEDKDLQPITLDLTAKNVELVLTQLTNQKLDYKWSFAQGVYDVYPRSNPDSILDVKIRRFKIKNLASDAASDLFGQIPEIKKWLVTHSVSRRELYVYGGLSKVSSGKLLTASFKNVSFRELLNTLIREFGIVDWVVVRYGNSRDYIAIYL